MRAATRSVIALLALAPLAAAQPRQEVFHFNSPADVIAVTHGGTPPLPLAPAGIRPLPLDPLGKSMVLVAFVRDASGRIVGTATEIEYYPGGRDRTKPWEAWWTLNVPGRGTIAGHETEAVPLDQRSIFEDLQRTGREWRGRMTARIATGPRPDGNGRILGGSGDWEGATGALSEWTTLTRVAPGGVLEGRIELRITREDPAP